MILCEWNGHKFEVSSNVIRTFEDLNLSADIETSDKSQNKQGYVELKKSKAVSVSMTALLYAVTGCQPEAEASEWLSDCTDGKSAYLYMGGEKVFTCEMMLTKVAVSDVVLTPNGSWSSCKVKLTFSQASLMNGKKVTTTKGGSTKPKTEETTTGGELVIAGEKQTQTVARNFLVDAYYDVKKWIKGGGVATKTVKTVKKH